MAERNPSQYSNKKYDNAEKEKEKEFYDIMRYGFRLAIGAILYPLDYAKVLIQLGYEPIPPTLGKSLFGRDILMLPNLFEYSNYIRRIDGFWGCYRGFTPKLLASVLGMSFSGYIVDAAGLNVPEETSKELDDEELYIRYKSCLKRDFVLTTTSIIISQPLNVISIRMMAQFIGRETAYNTLIGSIKEIYGTEGIAGFFSGLMPKLLCELACFTLTSSTVYLLNNYFVKDRLERLYNAGITQYLFSSILYPLQVVSTCMSVTGSRLMAGQPPLTPLYSNMFDCIKDLQIRGELKRGSSIIFRSLPITVRADGYKHTLFKVDLPHIAKYN